MLEVRGIVKEFPGVRALDGVDLALAPGEVHVVIGENGAGKSTLMKVLAGIHPPTAGEVLLDGRPLALESPQHAMAVGIATIHQELALVRGLTVAENIALGREPRLFGFPGAPLDRASMRAMAKRALAFLSSAIDPDARAGALPVGAQQLVEIAKALVREPKVLILDEPTASLSSRESEALFRVLEELKKSGVALAFISHRLDDIYRVGDRITVLRDGRTVHTGRVSEITPDALIAAMVGRTVTEQYPAREGEPPPPERDEAPVLRVERLSRRGLYADVSFTVRAGEIVGMAGLVGAGRTEVARAIAGALPADTGAVWLEGKPFCAASPGEALASGVAYLSEDRKGDGLVLGMSVADNAMLSRVAAEPALDAVDRVELDAAAGRMVRELSVKTPGVDTPVGNLSGGNQQKVLLGRCLSVDPVLVIADEPTRGVDVGARAEIYARLRALTREGKAVLLISSDLPEVLGMADRVLVMCEGRVAAQFSGTLATSESVLAAMLPASAVRP